jgi:primosomal protein N' (replication factor Y)
MQEFCVLIYLSTYNKSMSERISDYYEVSLALNGSWENNLYTYSFDGQLKVGQVVIAPFGKNSSLGIVRRNVGKPSFITKNLKLLEDVILPTKTSEFLHWLESYYPIVPGYTAQLFLPSFLKKSLKNDKTTKEEKKSPVPLLPLTESQESALKDITSDATKNIVLHGITGSGKTRVYMELIERAFALNKNVLLLYPEISLTAQLGKVLKSHFGDDKVHIYNSKRTTVEQRKTWLMSLGTSGGNVFIGPRSALFLPISSIEYVIIDESHDSAFKQDNGNRYNGVIAAAALARLHNAQLILGSATPGTEETTYVLEKNGKLVCMHTLAIESSHAEKAFHVVDMTNTQNLSKRSYLLSKKLLLQIREALEAKQQSLLFLNRRGTAKMLLCENCGWHAECSRCDMPMTYHHDSFSLQCHVCGNRDSVPVNCPACRASLTQKSPGIKAIEQELTTMFPQARIARFDSDNNKASSFTTRHKEVASGAIDILIGTQLITKGLDLPKLGLVGVLQADSSLQLPDYTSEERTFQQLSQVSGRVGRGHSKGVVTLQTYDSNNSLFDYVKAQNWHGFYEHELKARKASHYPPYKYLMKIWLQRTSSNAAEKAIERLAGKINSGQINVLGPAPSFYEKVNNTYSWHIILRSSNRKELLNILAALPKDAYVDIDPVSLL